LKKLFVLVFFVVASFVVAHPTAIGLVANAPKNITHAPALFSVYISRPESISNAANSTIYPMKFKVTLKIAPELNKPF
jgi:hypothetical protein